jgi:hypothetical protein
MQLSRGRLESLRYEAPHISGRQPAHPECLMLSAWVGSSFGRAGKSHANGGSLMQRSTLSIQVRHRTTMPERTAENPERAQLPCSRPMGSICFLEFTLFFRHTLPKRRISAVSFPKESRFAKFGTENVDVKHRRRGRQVGLSFDMRV